jgi:prefoldin subunit 5
MYSNEAAELRDQLQKLTDALQAMQLAIEHIGHQLEELQRTCRKLDEPTPRPATAG